MRGQLHQWLRLGPHCLLHKCSLKNAVFRYVTYCDILKRLLRKSALKTGTHTRRWKFELCKIVPQCQQQPSSCCIVNMNYVTYRICTLVWHEPGGWWLFNFLTAVRGGRLRHVSQQRCIWHGKGHWQCPPQGNKMPDWLQACVLCILIAVTDASYKNSKRHSFCGVLCTILVVIMLYYVILCVWCCWRRRLLLHGQVALCLSAAQLSCVFSHCVQWSTCVCWNRDRRETEKRKRKKGKRKNGKPKFSRKKGKRKIGKLGYCICPWIILSSGLFCIVCIYLYTLYLHWSWTCHA